MFFEGNSLLSPNFYLSILGQISQVISEHVQDSSVNPGLVIPVTNTVNGNSWSLIITRTAAVVTWQLLKQVILQLTDIAEDPQHAGILVNFSVHRSRYSFGNGFCDGRIGETS